MKSRRLFFLTIVFIALFSSCDPPVQNKGTDLPVMKITTENAAPIISKEVYVNGHIEISTTDENNVIDIIASGDMEIKGRGNSTWLQPKKPYRIKFKEKQSFFGFPASKHWVILANYIDKCMLRNEVAFGMGRMSKLAWTPRTQYVEVYLNDDYVGVYQLTEHIRIDKDRVNVTDEGYIIEVDTPGKVGPDDVTFETERELFTIKDPDVVEGDEKYNWIKDHITFIEDLLYSDNFLDEETGYKNYVDIESFVEWYLINEIAKNPDACFVSSCYMNIAPGGKLKMGPLWDFDIAFGDDYFYYYDPSPNNFCVKPAKWIHRMFLDPEFVDLVKQRFVFFKSNKDKIISSLTSNALNIQTSAVRDEQRWQKFKIGDDEEVILDKVKFEVKYVEEWIDQRFDWLENAYNEMED